MIRMEKKWFVFVMALAACAVLGASGNSAQGTMITKVSSEFQPDYNKQLTEEERPEITSQPFDFGEGPPFASISALELTFTMSDGDSAEGEFDHDDLAISLDGHQPSDHWLMNGFPDDPNRINNETDWDDPTWVTNTFTLDVTDKPTFADAMLDELGVGGDQELSLRLWDLDATMTTGKNRVRFSSEHEAELEITGTTTPEPSTMALSLVGLTVAGAGLILRRRSFSSS